MRADANCGSKAPFGPKFRTCLSLVFATGLTLAVGSVHAQTLAELVEKALISEPGVLSARSDLTAAEARYDQRAGALWPQVEATPNTAYNRRSYTSQPQPR